MKDFNSVEVLSVSWDGERVLSFATGGVRPKIIVSPAAYVPEYLRKAAAFMTAYADVLDGESGRDSGTKPMTDEIKTSMLALLEVCAPIVDELYEKWKKETAGLKGERPADECASCSQFRALSLSMCASCGKRFGRTGRKGGG